MSKIAANKVITKEFKNNRDGNIRFIQIEKTPSGKKLKFIVTNCCHILGDWPLNHTRCEYWDGAKWQYVHMFNNKEYIDIDGIREYSWTACNAKDETYFKPAIQAMRKIAMDIVED